MNSKPDRETLAGFRAPWSVFWAAFLVRVLYLTLAHTFRIRPYDNHFQFGWEMGRIASALASGQGFSNPFRGQTGPTAWVAPAFPFLLSLIFKIFGIFTLKSAWVILTFDSFFSALTARAIWEIGSRCFNLRVARWSAWIWALYPAAMQYAVRWVWETTLTTMLFSFVLVLALRTRHIGEQSVGELPAASQESTRLSIARWALFGLLWGLIGLNNPSLLLFLPVCGVWMLARNGGWQREARGAMVSALIFAGCVAPWTWRNWAVFHRLVPMRSNFGVELYLGNGPGAAGLLMEYDQPMQSPDEMRLYARMGEVEYSRMRGREAMGVIRSNPRHFLADTLKRIFFFWGGVPQAGLSPLIALGRNFNFVFTSVCGLLGLALALSRRAPAAGLFAFAFLLLPAVYYVTTAQARFRHPIEPLIDILGVYLFQSAEPARRASRLSSSRSQPDLAPITVDHSSAER